MSFFFQQNILTGSNFALTRYLDVTYLDVRHVKHSLRFPSSRLHNLAFVRHIFKQPAQHTSPDPFCSFRIALLCLCLHDFFEHVAHVRLRLALQTCLSQIECQVFVHAAFCCTYSKCNNILYLHQESGICLSRAKARCFTAMIRAIIKIEVSTCFCCRWQDNWVIWVIVSLSESCTCARQV